MQAEHNSATLVNGSAPLNAKPGFMWPRPALHLLLALTVIAVTLVSCSQPDPVNVATEYVGSRQAGDVEGAIAMFAPDAVLYAPNQVLYRGQDEIRAWLATTLRDYYYIPGDPAGAAAGHIAWTDNLYSRSGDVWVGELSADVQVTDLHIKVMRSQVLKGASGVICPRCGPLIASPGGN